MDKCIQQSSGDDETLKQQLARAGGAGSSKEQGGQAVIPGSPTATYDLEGKLVIDLKDPNRPRFTLEELKQVS